MEQLELRQQQGASLRRLCYEGDVMLVQHMVRNGAPIDAAQADGCTGLWLAAEQGHTEVVQLLCEHGANVHQLKQPGDVTPLYVAAQNGHTAVVKLLLRFGALPNAAKTSGTTPLYIAAQQNFTDIVVELLQAGASVAHANQQGITPLAIAAFQGNVECVQALLASGADPRALSCGKTALEWAESNGHGLAIGRAIQEHLEDRAMEAERRQRLVSATDITPLQRSERLQVEQQRLLRQSPLTTAGGASAIDTSGALGGASATPAGRQRPFVEQRERDWYTPKFLTRQPTAYVSELIPSGSPARPTVTALGRSPVPSDARSPRRLNSSLTPSTKQRSSGFSGWHAAAPVVAPSPSMLAGTSGFFGGGGVNPTVLQQEAERNEAFRKQISKPITPLSLPTDGSGSSAITKGSMYEVDQSWAAFKSRLLGEERELDQSKADVTNAWMLSLSSVTQYEEALRKLRHEQRDIAVRNREKLVQDKEQRERNPYTYPPLPADELGSLRRFIHQGAAAKGPPPPPEDAAGGGGSTAGGRGDPVATSDD